MPASVMRLPYEILQLIFELVCARKSSPYNLSLTCRTWYRVASATSRLWNKIYFGSRHDYIHPENRVRCSSLESLAAALNRIGEVPFELIISCRGMWIDREELDRFKTSVGDECLSRCHSLIWLHMSALSGWHLFLQILSAVRYSSLEVLKLWSMTGPIAPELTSFLDNIQATAPFLRSVTFEGQASDCSPIRLRQYTELLRRLKQLRIAIPHDSTWTNLEALEELKMSTKSGHLLLPDSKNVRRATLIHTGNIRVIDFEICLNLVKLSIHCDQYWWLQCPDGASEVSLPSLVSLEVRGTLLAVPPINAPKLDTITLLTSTTSRRDTIFPTKTPQFKPRAFSVDKPFGEPELLKVLENIWDGLEELQITILRLSDSLGTKFTKAICGTPSIFPRLQSLTVICPHRHDYQSRPPTINNLGKIVEALRPRGLKTVRCGWYSNSSSSPSDSPEERGDWRINWQTLL